jgi:hypothetical protein
MIERTINGKRKLCYLLKKGEMNDIVIPYDALADVDVRRMHDMEAQGGELMRVMRDTTLENGANALSQYQDLIITVQVDQPKAAVAAGVQEESVAPATQAKRGRGRPKGSKNKSK